MSLNPTILDLLSASLEKGLAEVHTAMPGIVVAYNATLQVCEVQPALKWRGEPLPLLLEVPVLWPGGGGYYAHFPLAKGDHVLLVFAENDTSDWYDKAEVSDVQIEAPHGLHAFAIPVARPTGKQLPVEDMTQHYGKAVIAKQGGTCVVLDSDGVTVRKVSDLVSPISDVALAPPVQSMLEAIVSKFNAHVHTSAAAGSPTTTPVSPNTLPTPVPQVASLTLKAQ